MDRGDSRNGKIVLVECAEVQDGDAGSRYTVKEYESIKVVGTGEWRHGKILLKPRSTNLELTAIELTEDNAHRYRVVGEFLGVIEPTTADN